MRIHSLGIAACVAAAMGIGSARAQDVPAGYPSDYAATIKAAKSEGTVSIYTSTDSAQAKALLGLVPTAFSSPARLLAVRSRRRRRSWTFRC